MLFPARGKVFGGSVRKSRMVKDELRLGPLLCQLDLYNRIVTGLPVDYSPRLNNPLVLHKLDLPSHNVPTEYRKCASNARG